MFQGVNKRQMEQAMRKMGVQQKEIPAEVVIIKTPEKEIIIEQPSVAQITMAGQLSFQISGKVSERAALRNNSESINSESIKTDDIDLVMEQTGASEKEAASALEKANGDIAEAILLLQKK